MSTPASDVLKATIRLPVTLSGEGSREFLDSVKRAFDLNDVIRIRVVDTAFEGKDTLLYLNFAKELLLEGPELGQASGVMAELGGMLTLRFDEAGELDSYVLDYQEKAGIDESKSGIIGLMKSGDIYFAQPGEEVDISALMRRRIKFYMQQDDQGRKRLHRVFFA